MSRRVGVKDRGSLLFESRERLRSLIYISCSGHWHSPWMCFIPYISSINYHTILNATKTSYIYESIYVLLGLKMARIFSDRIRDRIRLMGFRSIRIRFQIFTIRYRIHIRILKSYIYDIDIQSYPIRHS